MQILSKNEVMAGSYKLMDHLALRIIQRSKIPTVILNGRSPSNVVRALRGSEIGTQITPD
jgi:uridylate kinase